MDQRAALHFAADHPTAPGHFPGNPIIPGAVILDEVVAAIGAAGGTTARAVRTMKFLRPVTPGESLTLSWSIHGADVARFECARADGSLAAAGELQLWPAAR